MTTSNTSLGYPTHKQGMIWFQRWHKKSVTDIARDLDVSKPMVSKAYRIALDRIGNLLHHTASTFRIEIERMSSELGLAVGHCNATNSQTYITYTPKLGVQTWFAHVGDCDGCDSRSKCDEYLAKLAKEWSLPLDDGLLPTEKGKRLFETMKRRLKWNE